ncbi:ABC transporter ATP-binding protein [[Phormidium ambiguum] IAM M-71]|uniref:ABC transporter ATP-binding protein n=1 Tax=[Phormidium ambiguum] IAM M-71 TaxID=454136 RepID=A0A1U7I8J7_9CYAN|nr:cyclic peptide export ABC transporter [Phormidium ambiguum]OKH32720.1 ABC transporter ATP-binding protein [Phormidium ambiguum IAM M-71]
MNLLKQLLYSFWQPLVLATITGLISGITTTGLIAVISGKIINPTFTLPLTGIFFSLCVLRLITGIISRVLLINLSQKIVLDLRMMLSRQILASPLFHLEYLGNHRILASLIDDIETLAKAAQVLPAFCGDIAIVTSCLLYLAWLSPSLFIIIFGAISIGIFSYQAVTNRAFRFLKQARNQQDKLFKYFNSLTAGIKELKLNQQRRQNFLIDGIYDTAQHYRRHNINSMTIFAVAATWGHLLFFLVVGIVLFALPAISSIPATILSSYAITIIYLISPLDYMMSVLPMISGAIVALQTIEALQLSLASSPQETLLGFEFESALTCKSLQLSGVTHTYYHEQEERAFKVGEINLTLSAGEIIFIAGGNGSGKSTLVKILAGLYPPELGEIYLDNQRITSEMREWYRQHFAVIFSDFYLFETLVKGKTIETDKKADDYLIKLQLDKKVTLRDNEFSTIALSQGQRKRLALLNAYLEDKPILIFDEWASDQDPIFKKIFYTELLPELKAKGKMVIAITHDDQYFHTCDRLIKLDYGKVVSDSVNSVSALSFT